MEQELEQVTSQRSRELGALEDSYKLRMKQLADNKDRESSVSTTASSSCIYVVAAAVQC